MVEKIKYEYEDPKAFAQQVAGEGRIIRSESKR